LEEHLRSDHPEEGLSFWLPCAEAVAKYEPQWSLLVTLSKAFFVENFFEVATESAHEVLCLKRDSRRESYSDAGEKSEAKPAKILLVDGSQSQTVFGK